MAEIVVKLVNGELAGKTAQTIAKEVNAAALALKKAEIGTKDWVAANERLEKAKGVQADLKKQIEGTASASDMLKKAWNTLPGAGFFNQIGQSFGMLKGGVGGLVTSFGVLRTAIIATGIGALVVIVASLFSWFTKTERGGDLLAKVMAAIGAAVSVLWDRLSLLVDALIAFATGNWSEAADKFSQATRNVTDELIAETKAAWELADALDQLEELEGKLILIRSRSREQISELRKIAKDETMTLEQRSDAIRTAIGLTQALTEQELKAKEGRVLQALQVKDLDALTKRYGVTLDELLQRGEEILSVDNLGMGESTQEDLNKAFEALAAYNEELTKSNDEQRTLLSELNKLNKKDRAEDTKNLKDKLKADQDALKEQQAALENIRKLEQEKRLLEIDDEKAREIEKINQAAEEKILALQGTEAQIFEQIKLIREMQGLELEAIEQKHENERIKNHEAYLAKLNADSEKWAEEQIRIDQQKADFARQMDQVRMDSAQMLTAFLADAIAKQLGDDKKAKAIKKTSALVDIGINLLKEKAMNAATAAANPLNAVTFGAAGAAQLLLLNQASNIRAGIAAARVLLFGRGGIPSGVLRGPSHAQGGIPLIAEGNEIIMTKGVFQNAGLRAMASAINVAGGGRSFADGGVPMPRSPFGDRAPVASGNAGGSSGNPLADIGDLKNAFMLYADEVRTWQRELRVNNNLQETQKGLTTLQQLKAEADV